MNTPEKTVQCKAEAQDHEVTQPVNLPLQVLRARSSPPDTVLLQPAHNKHRRPPSAVSQQHRSILPYWSRVGDQHLTIGPDPANPLLLHPCVRNSPFRHWSRCAQVDRPWHYASGFGGGGAHSSVYIQAIVMLGRAVYSGPMS